MKVGLIILVVAVIIQTVTVSGEYFPPHKENCNPHLQNDCHKGDLIASAIADCCYFGSDFACEAVNDGLRNRTVDRDISNRCQHCGNGTFECGAHGTNSRCVCDDAASLTVVNSCVCQYWPDDNPHHHLTTEPSTIRPATSGSNVSTTAMPTIEPPINSTTTAPQKNISTTSAQHNSTTAEPPNANSTTIEPPNNATTVEPPNNSTTVEPPNNSTTVEPPSNSTTVEPPNNSTTVEPPNNSTTVEPPNNSTTVEPPNNSTTVEPPKHSTTVNPPNIFTTFPAIDNSTTVTERPKSHSQAVKIAVPVVILSLFLVVAVVVIVVFVFVKRPCFKSREYQPLLTQ